MTFIYNFFFTLFRIIKSCKKYVNLIVMNSKYTNILGGKKIIKTNGVIVNLV